MNDYEKRIWKERAELLAQLAELVERGETMAVGHMTVAASLRSMADRMRDECALMRVKP